MSMYTEEKTLINFKLYFMDIKLECKRRKVLQKK